MTATFLGQVIMIGGTYAPRGFAFCNGGTLPIAQNTALYALLGTTYGGDGRTSFGLPDLRGRAPVHSTTGAPGVSAYPLGTMTGTETVTLTTQQIAAHSHYANGLTATGNATSPSGAIWAEGPIIGGRGGSAPNLYAASTNASMSTNALRAEGGSQPHSNIQPSIAINYCIALQGIFPTRN